MALTVNNDANTTTKHSISRFWKWDEQRHWNKIASTNYQQPHIEYLCSKISERMNCTLAFNIYSFKLLQRWIDVNSPDSTRKVSTETAAENINTPM